MKKIFIITYVFSMFSVFAADTIQPDIKAGEAKSAICAACHGKGGTGINPLWPKLAGQGESYIKKQLHDFKAGDRTDPVMQAQAASLSDQDIANVAAYFSSQEIHLATAGKTADQEQTAELLKRGRDLFKGGRLSDNVAACASCHGPTGEGIHSAKYPVITGQYDSYVAKQLKAFRLGSQIDEQSTDVNVSTLPVRTNDPNKMMRDTAGKLSDRDIEALSYYIQGLRP